MIDLVKAKLKLLKMSKAVLDIEELLREAELSNQSYLLFLNELLESEIEGRTKKRIERRIYSAGFPYLKYLNDFDFSLRPSINKHEILSLAQGNFVEQKENIVFIGNPGLGKTHLAIAIAYELCLMDKKVWFTQATYLINKLREARDEKILSRYLKQAREMDLVVLDEIGYFPFEKEDSELLFQFISERYERGSTIFTTNLPFSKWNEIFYTERLTTAILDRVIHHCHILEMQGESYRFNHSVNKTKKKKKREA